MFRKPEELILAVVAVIWLILTFFLARRLGLDWTHTGKITVATAVWAVLLFVLWRKDWLDWVWPCFLGLLVACWLPFLDALALRRFAATGDALIVTAPWYASVTFKTIIVLVPVILAYLSIWRMRAQKTSPKH